MAIDLSIGSVFGGGFSSEVKNATLPGSTVASRVSSDSSATWAKRFAALASIELPTSALLLNECSLRSGVDAFICDASSTSSEIVAVPSEEKIDCGSPAPSGVVYCSQYPPPPTTLHSHINVRKRSALLTGA